MVKYFGKYDETQKSHIFLYFGNSWQNSIETESTFVAKILLFLLHVEFWKSVEKCCGIEIHNVCKKQKIVIYSRSIKLKKNIQEHKCVIIYSYL